MVQFLAFVRGTRLLDGKTDLNITKVDLLFFRATRTTGNKRVAADWHKAALASTEELFELNTTGGSTTTREVAAAGVEQRYRDARRASNVMQSLQDAAELAPSGKSMRQHHFVSALVHLAALRFSKASSLADAVHRICEQHLHTHVYCELNLLQDEFSHIMNQRGMQEVLHRNAAHLEEIFRYYATVDQRTWEAKSA